MNRENKVKMILYMLQQASDREIDLIIAFIKGLRAG